MNNPVVDPGMAREEVLAATAQGRRSARVSWHTAIGLAFMLLLSTQARADVVLLIHGYQGNVLSWENSGVVPVLQHFGWKRAALLLGEPQGLVSIALPWQEAENKVVNLGLYSEAPLMAQSNVVIDAIRWIYDRYPGEQIILVGHSLGGLVARLALVRAGARDVKALVTIASPHQGTELAYEGLDELDEPFPIDIMKKFFGGSSYDMLRRSRGLLYDLLPPMPGKLLFWLNSRVHPDIHYFSVVRSLPNGMLGDIVVPGYSQDMANIVPIGQRSTRYIQGFTHWLSIQDGYTLINILGQLK